MAALINGASTVNTPSGDREDVTFSTFADGGRLVARMERQHNESKPQKTVGASYLDKDWLDYQGMNVNGNQIQEQLI